MTTPTQQKVELDVNAQRAKFPCVVSSFLHYEEIDAFDDLEEVSFQVLKMLILDLSELVSTHTFRNGLPISKKSKTSWRMQPQNRKFTTNLWTLLRLPWNNMTSLFVDCFLVWIIPNFPSFLTNGI